MKEPLLFCFVVVATLLVVLVLGACPSGVVGDEGPAGKEADGGREQLQSDALAEGPGGERASQTFVVVTFNTGTTEGQGQENNEGYTSRHADLSDKYYGNGLAWNKAVQATKAFFARLRPDVVVFQEIFYSENCASIPAQARKDFVCETWKPGAPTVAQIVLGTDYQLLCHPNKPDKCAAVKKSFGTFRGCQSDFCLSGLTGFRVKDCGGGARVGRGVIDLHKSPGRSLTLVSVHGTSGLQGDDILCRVKQVEQVFVDLGDGEPGANGSRNLIMGDFNTDPARSKSFDKSAQRWNDFVGATKKFHFISEVGPKARPSYAGLFNIDHVVSDVATGRCWIAGVTEGHPPVLGASYFDHKPIVCVVSLP